MFTSGMNPQRLSKLHVLKGKCVANFKLNLPLPCGDLLYSRSRTKPVVLAHPGDDQERGIMCGRG